MKFEFIYDPVPLIIIRDIFTKKENAEILAEVIKNKENFKPAIAIGKIEEFRNNIISDYDMIYSQDRTKSILLTLIDKNFNNKKFIEIINSFVYPINLLGQTNTHESQVSRYGDQGQEYKYHIDSFAENNNRMITLVYYFHKEPKKYKGGEIQFTRSPIHDGKVMDKNETPITITPENNMMVVFNSKVAHTVLPTTSPKTFDKGRFSVNIWVGVR
jgi:Rps23 Pro-64 3,4-dihydroxylase Tpa1-like proline 4-hydroxylase